MRRSIMLLLAVAVTVMLPVQPSAQTSNGSSQDGVPSVTDPSVPLSYVGNNGSVSLGINSEGKSEGQLLGVFARNNERALVGQLWWDRNGAGGVQSDFNWLWGGMTALEAREHPDAVTVARLSLALDQNQGHDRKATLGFGIERREFSLEGYLSRAVTGARSAGSALHSDVTTITGVDDIGNYTQVETSAVETLFARKPYGVEAGFQLSHVFEPLTMRVHAGASTQSGDGARASTFSAGLDTPLGTRGWGLSALAEHVSRQGDVDGGHDDDRFSIYLRYEFGSHGSFVPTSELEDPAWIARSLARPSSAHPRIVETHLVRRSQSTVVTRDPKQYTNRFPLAHDDNATVVGGQSITIDVLANDSDADNDPLAVTAVTTPTHGSAAISGTLIVYTPAANFIGSDSFRYTVSDGRGGTANALVSVTIGARPNQAPLARNDSTAVAFGQRTTIDVLANDSDPDGDALNVDSVGAPAHGTAVLSGHVVTYTPAPGFSGTDQFTYVISDGRGGTATATVSILVAPRLNRVPFARNDNATVGSGVPATIDVLANDSDPDGDALALVSVTAPAHGTAAISGMQVLYTPAPGFSGADSFNYTIRDGHGGSATATVSITVAAQPNRPPVAVDDAATTTFPLPVTINVLTNDSDPDGDPLTIVGVTAPTSGTAVISGNSVIYTPSPQGLTGIDVFTYTISDGRGGNATATVTVTVAPPPNLPPVAVNDAATTPFGVPVTINVLGNDSDPDGDPLTITGVTAPASGTAVISGNSVIYTSGSAAGIDTFTYTISDGRGGTATATVTVTVGPLPNTPPVAVNDAATTPLGVPVTINVLGNDSDPDGDPLTIASITPPVDGTAVISGNSVIYTPGPAAATVGVDTFTYTISDGRGGTATATVRVTFAPAPNQPPIAVDDIGAPTANSQPRTIPVLANDSDPDGDPLTIISVTMPTSGTVLISGNSVIYTSAAGFAGTDSFTYTISDGRGGTATATVTIVVLGPVPKPTPVAFADPVVAPAVTPVAITAFAHDNALDGNTSGVIGFVQPIAAVASAPSASLAACSENLRFPRRAKDDAGSLVTAVVDVTWAS
ncbi:MAG: Ig-like domain-containing protein [Dokdonella sp.]